MNIIFALSFLSAKKWLFFLLVVLCFSRCSFFDSPFSGVWISENETTLLDLSVKKDVLTGNFSYTELTREGLPHLLIGGELEGTLAEGGFRFSYTSDSGEFGTGSLGKRDSQLVLKFKRSLESTSKAFLPREILLHRKD